jgi:hypothetical protein
LVNTINAVRHCACLFLVFWFVRLPLKSSSVLLLLLLLDHSCKSPVGALNTAAMHAGMYALL